MFSPRKHLSLVWRRSPRKCTVMPFAPACSQITAAVIMLGSIVLRVLGHGFVSDSALEERSFEPSVPLLSRLPDKPSIAALPFINMSR